MSQPKSFLMFVYGTLMSGYGNGAVLLAEAEFLGEAVTDESYTLRIRGIPYVNKTPATTPIMGEVYRVTKRELEAIDGLEGHPNWYKREEIPVTVRGEKMSAWIYFNAEKDATISPTGNFREPFKEEDVSTKKDTKKESSVLSED